MIVLQTKIFGLRRTMGIVQCYYTVTDYYDDGRVEVYEELSNVIFPDPIRF